MGRVADKDRVDWGSGRVEQGGRKRHKVEVEVEQGRDKRSSHLKLVCGSSQLPRRNLTNFLGQFLRAQDFVAFLRESIHKQFSYPLLLVISTGKHDLVNNQQSTPSKNNTVKQI